MSNTSVERVYDLQVHITDYQSRSDLIEKRAVVQNSMGFLKVFNPCDISTTIQMFDKNTTVILASFPELYAHRHTLKVHTILTHGSFVQHQEFSHIGNHQWIFAEKVVNAITGKVLYNKFPTSVTVNAVKHASGYKTGRQASLPVS